MQTGLSGQGYPADHLDCFQMTRVLRHRLRNLCAGMKMALESIGEQVTPTHPHLKEHFGLMTDELDDLLRFTTRLDSVFAPVENGDPLGLMDLLQDARDEFTRTFPFCSIQFEGDEDVDVELPQGTHWRSILRELLTNAGEAAGREGEVKVVWCTRPAVEIAIVNTADGWPEDIPVGPPEPFRTRRGRHDGIGLSIAQRLCNCVGAQLDINTELPGMIVAKVTGTPVEGEE